MYLPNDFMRIRREAQWRLRNSCRFFLSTRSVADQVIYKNITHFTLHFLSDWRVSDSSPLAYLHEHTCQLDIGAFLHCKDSKGLLREFGLWCCESWWLGENEKVKHDFTTQRYFLRCCWNRRDVILFSVVRKITASRENRGELLGDEVMKTASHRNCTL